MLISVITPCRNEGRDVLRFVDGVGCQRLRPGWSLELVVADGRSDDGTRELLDQAAARDLRLTVLDNPRRTTPAALNLAVRRARGAVLVRMDVHTVYAEDYVLRCVGTLLSTGADCVGILRIADPDALLPMRPVFRQPGKEMVPGNDEDPPRLQSLIKLGTGYRQLG